MTPLGHIVSTIAIWTMMLFGIRFAVAAAQWLRPMRLAVWRLWRCREPDKAHCRATFAATVDNLHDDLRSAMTTPWSATLLFVGSILIGAAFAFGSAGDAAKLVSRQPDSWSTFDIACDLLAGGFAVTGMAMIQAATAARRTVSFWVSAALVVTGLGVGIVTL